MSTSSPGDKVATRLPGWAKITLVLSLALNLGVAGVVAGSVLRGAPQARDAAFNLPIEGFRNIARAMPPDDRAALRADWIGQQRDIRAARRALRQSRGAFIAALRTEPFSPLELEQILEGQAQTWQTFGAKSREILVARLAAMTPEARMAFADNLEASLQRRRPVRAAPPD